MSSLITQILCAVLAIVLAILTRVVIPWIRGLTTAEQRAQALAIVRTLVGAAEQILGDDLGARRKQWVLDRLADHDIRLTDRELDAMIEATVLALHNDLTLSI